MLARFQVGVDVGEFVLNSAFVIQRLAKQVAELSGGTVEAVLQEETAAALHEQGIVEKIHEAMSGD